MKKRLVLIVLLLLTGSFTLLAQINKPDSTASKKEAAVPAITPAKTDTTKNSKTKSTEKKDAEKALKQAVQKRQADSLAAIKTLKINAKKRQEDSLANIKTLKQLSQKKQADSLAAAKDANLASLKAKRDSVASARKGGSATLQKTDAVLPAPKKDSAAATKNIGNTILPGKKDTVANSKVLSQNPGKAKPDTVHTAKISPQIAPLKNIRDTTVTKKDAGKKDKKKSNDKKALPDSLSAKTKVKPPKGKSAKQLKREAEKNDPTNFTGAALARVAFQDLSKDSSIINSPVKRADISFTNARPLPLTEPGVNNVKFYHRYWRDIDLQNPKNKRFASYHADLITSLLASIKKKEIRAYSPVASPPENPTGDAFTVPIAYDQLMSGLSDTAVVNIVDTLGNITGTKTIPNPFTPEKISGYRLKEDVFYDRTRSRSYTRIIGIAPLVKLTLSSGEVISIQPLCWLKYKDCRKILVTIDVDPTKKVGDSMDDVFLQRRFTSSIVQESNTEGKRIKDYKTEPADQEIEARRMEKKIVSFKKGSWNYTMLAENAVTVDDNKPPKIKKTDTKPDAKTSSKPDTKSAKPK